MTFEEMRPNMRVYYISEVVEPGKAKYGTLVQLLNSGMRNAWAIRFDNGGMVPLTTRVAAYLYPAPN